MQMIVLWIWTLVAHLVTPDKGWLPLGHQSPALPIEEIQGFVPPEEFFNKYVIEGKPVVLKGAVASYPAVQTWTDKYFLSRPESRDWMVGYEVGKKETRQGGQDPISFSEYVERYMTEDLYCVTGLPKFLRPDVPVYDSINCGILTQQLMDDMVLWFSSGGTRSVWHYDDYENLNCLMQGTKELILANRSEMELGHFDVKGDSYSTVDVDAVNLDKYPDFANITFYNATIEAGDCVYIPSFWSHTVKSFGRNIAINAWWELYKKPITCSEEERVSDWSQVLFKTDSDFGKEEELHDVDTNAPRALAAHLRLVAWVSQPMRVRGDLNMDEFVLVMEEGISEFVDEEKFEALSTGSKGDWERMFELLDVNKNGVLSPVEIHLLEDDNSVLHYFNLATQAASEDPLKREL